MGLPSTPISITLTLGDLAPELKSIDSYGIFLRGFNQAKEEVKDDPRRHAVDGTVAEHAC